jgi:alpha-L-fucosidase
MKTNWIVFFFFICDVFNVKWIAAQLNTGYCRAVLVDSELIFCTLPFKQCHASSLVELSGERIFAVWFWGTHERHPDVCIWGSIRSDKGWSKPILLADGVINETLRYPCWNPVLFKTGKGELYLFYKVGPSPGEWWGMYKKSVDEGKTWSVANRLPSGILGPIRNKPIYTSTGRIISPSSSERGEVWNAHMEISDDGGKTWSKVALDSTTGFKLIQPTLLTLNNGTILALLRSNQNCVVESKSIDGGNTWSTPVKTSILNPNSGIDAVTLKNGLHILVYNPSNAGKEWWEGRSRLYVSVSPNGEDWHDVYKLEDETSGEFSYPAVIQTSDGLVHVTYTSNRVSIRHVVLRVE